MTEVISFYSVAPSQGKRTLSNSFANLLGNNELKTLYVELDTENPSLAVSTQIQHPTNNLVAFFENTIKTNDFNVEPYVLTREQLLKTDSRDLKKVFSELPSCLDYLCLPIGFSSNDFPELLDYQKSNIEEQANLFIQQFIYALKTSKYQYVVLNLPNDLSNIFGFEVLDSSDHIIHVSTASANRLSECNQILNFLESNIKDLEQKWSTVLNMTSPYIEDASYRDLVKGNPFIIPFDPERQQSEFALESGSELITERMEQIAEKLKIPISIEPKKKSFSLFTKGGK